MKDPPPPLKMCSASDLGHVSLVVVIGGFEERALRFVQDLVDGGVHPNNALLLEYAVQATDNDQNHRQLTTWLKGISENPLHVVRVDPDLPGTALRAIHAAVASMEFSGETLHAFVDVSGMTHLLSVSVIDVCRRAGLSVSVVYSEASEYFPRRRERDRVLNWRDGDSESAKLLQSAGLRAIHIPPEFAGHFRPDAKVCLAIFVGYEPNRIQGLIDQYAPGAILALYGSPPHEQNAWRNHLSKELHADVLARWRVRSVDVSTLDVSNILSVLEAEYRVIGSEYDLAISPQCSKMQAVCSYLFWKRHPETQLVFTSPLSFKRDRYSAGVGRTYCVPLVDYI